MNRNKTGMLIFIGSEAFFFLALIIAYVYYTHPGGKLDATAQYLDFKKTAVFTLFLFSSSFTMEMASRRIKQGSRRGMIGWLVLTVILGTVFISGQGMEYSRLIHQDVTISRNVFGSSFFTLTGFHGLHVAGGLLLQLMMIGLALGGNFRVVRSVMFDSVSLYWHFVDAVWVFIFSIVYIGAIV
ncbi:MAG TPA: cytochrome c oxidase subunit 3 [Bacteroidales bacterium]|nr:cytochrome c oxidase subunit 3 [Bacteroidales bacterium]